MMFNSLQHLFLSLESTWVRKCNHLNQAGSLSALGRGDGTERWNLKLLLLSHFRCGVIECLNFSKTGGGCWTEQGVNTRRSLCPSSEMRIPGELQSKPKSKTPGQQWVPPRESFALEILLPWFRLQMWNAGWNLCPAPCHPLLTALF